MAADPRDLREAQARQGHAIGGLKSQQKYLRDQLAACLDRQGRTEFRVLLIAAFLACFFATLIVGNALSGQAI